MRVSTILSPVKSGLILVILTLVLVLTSKSWSQTAMESFTYPTGQYLDSLGAANNGWGGPWKIDTTNQKYDSMCVVADTGFDYVDMNYSVPNVGGNATLSLPGGWSKSARYKRPLAKVWPDMKGQYWVSYLFDTKGDPSGDGGSSYFLFKLYSGQGYYSSGELTALGKGGGAVNYSCGSGWPGSATAAGESSTIDQGGPVWLVAMINMTGDASQDAAARIFMWINPDPSTAPDTNNADAKNTIDLSKGIGAVGIEAGGQDTIQLAYDEIRLGTSYADVSSSLVTPGHHANEFFKYSAGADLNGQGSLGNGWAGAWHLDPGDATVSDSVFMVVDKGIDYTSMNYNYPHSGNLVYAYVDSAGSGKYSRMERTLDKVWPPTAGTQYWFSVFMYIQNDTNTSTWCGVKLADPGHSDAAVMFGKGYGQALYTVGGGYHGTTNDPEVSTTSWDVGPVWLLGEIINNGADSSGYAYMWINPDPSTQPDTSIADAKSSSGSRVSGLSDVRLEAGGGIPYQVYFSDLRLDTSFADIVTGIKEKFKEFVATTYKLSQNYPNPFNPTTRIDYTLKQSGKVRLSVYDILGREVSVLVNKEQKAGNYEVSFNGANLASGVYFYRLQAGNKMISKKMILLK